MTVDDDDDDDDDCDDCDDLFIFYQAYINIFVTSSTNDSLHTACL